MKCSSYIALFGIFLLLIFISPVKNSFAQSTITINQADRGEGGIIDGQNVRKILGNVSLSTDRMTMDADSVYQFTGQNMIQAFNVQIETDRDMIWADTIYHNTRTDFSELRGRVIVQSENNTIFSQEIDVDNPIDLAIFNAPLRFEDRRGTLLAESGLYNQAVDSAIFRGNVQLSDSTQYLEADSLFMNRSSDLYELHSRVYAEDFEDKVIFTSDYLYADSTGYRLLTGEEVWLMEISESEVDTTHLYSQEIELFETDTLSTMNAYRDVRIWSTKFSAIADTAMFRDDIDQFLLRSNPVLWQKNIQLSGPVIEAFLENDDIKFLSSYENPIAVQEDTLTGRLHQMTGDTLHSFFDDGAISRLVMFNNSEIIFHLTDEDDQPDGLIHLIASGASTMFFQDGEFDEFKAIQNPNGSYLPENPVNIDRKLDNFRWDPELKPQRPLIQMRRLPTIPEEKPFDLPPRYIEYLRELENSADSTGVPN